MLVIPYQNLPKLLLEKLCEAQKLPNDDNLLESLQIYNNTHYYKWPKIAQIFTKANKLITDGITVNLFPDMMVLASLFQVDYNQTILELDNDSIIIYTFFMIHLMLLHQDDKVKLAELVNSKLTYKKKILTKYNEISSEIFYLCLDNFSFWKRTKIWLLRIGKNLDEMPEQNYNFDIFVPAILKKYQDKNSDLEKHLTRLCDVLDFIKPDNKLLFNMKIIGYDPVIEEKICYYRLMKNVLKLFDQDVLNFFNPWIDNALKIKNRIHFYQELCNLNGFVFSGDMMHKTSGKITDVFNYSEDNCRQVINNRFSNKSYKSYFAQNLCFTKFTAYFDYPVKDLDDAELRKIPFLPVTKVDDNYIFSEQQEEIIYLNPVNKIDIPFACFFKLRFKKRNETFKYKFLLEYQEQRFTFNDEHLAQIYNILYFYPETKTRKDLQRFILATKDYNKKHVSSLNYYHADNLELFFNGVSRKSLETYSNSNCYQLLFTVLSAVSEEDSLATCQNISSKIKNIIVNLYDGESSFLLHYLSFVNDNSQKFFFQFTVTAEIYKDYLHSALFYKEYLNGWLNYNRY